MFSFFPHPQFLHFLPPGGVFQSHHAIPHPQFLSFLPPGGVFSSHHAIPHPQHSYFLPSGGAFPPNHSILPFPQPYKTSYSSWNNEFSLQNSLAGRSRARVIFQFARIPILVRVCLLYRGKCSNKAKKTCPDSFRKSFRTGDCYCSSSHETSVKMSLPT